VIYANAASSNWIGQSQNRIQKSVDHGRTWSSLGSSSTFLYQGGCRPLAMSRSVPGLLYASVTGGCVGYPENCCGDCSGAIYKSTNGGVSWQEVSGNLPMSPWAPFDVYHLPFPAVAVDPTNASRVYAGGRANPYAGVAPLYVTTDGGTTWMPTDTGLGQIDVHTISVCPSDPTRILLSSDYGVFLSENSGASWSKTSTTTRLLPFVFDPANPLRVYTPLNKSMDGGQTWIPMATPGGAQEAVGLDGARNELYAAGTTGVYRSADGGTTWSQILSTGGCSALAVLPDLAVARAARPALSSAPERAWRVRR
jgi:hypothetical protein